MEEIQKTFENEYAEAVLEYRVKQKEVVKSFVVGIIELWGILNTHRAKMKEQWARMQYCEDVGIHITQANNQIRMYEYSLKKTQNEMLWKVVTNWSKLNFFLSLSDGEKEKVLQSEQITEETSSSEFREIVSEIKWGQIEQPTEWEEQMVWKNLSEVLEWENPMLENPKFAAKSIQQTQGLHTSSVQHVEALVLLEKALELLTKQITETKDKEIIKERLETQIDKLQQVLSSLQ